MKEHDEPMRGRLRIRVNRRALARELAVVAGLGALFTGLGLWVLAESIGWSLVEALDVWVTLIVGVGSAAAGRATALAHRRWKRAIGPWTAAAALCAVVAIAGSLLVLIPPECPGAIPGGGRCGRQDASAWGFFTGLLSAFTFVIAGITLKFVRKSLGVAGWTAGGVKRLVSRRRARGEKGVQKPQPPSKQDKSAGSTAQGKPEADSSRGAGQRKGRPTVRQADARRARKERLSARK